MDQYNHADVEISHDDDMRSNDSLSSYGQKDATPSDNNMTL